MTIGKIRNAFFSFCFESNYIKTAWGISDGGGVKLIVFQNVRIYVKNMDSQILSTK